MPHFLLQIQTILDNPLTESYVYDLFFFMKPLQWNAKNHC
jgi:hypothetical protein